MSGTALNLVSLLLFRETRGQSGTSCRTEFIGRTMLLLIAVFIPLRQTKPC